MNNYASESPKNNKTSKWYQKGETIIIQGYEISDGLIYVGESLPNPNRYGNDASLINPKLKILRAEPWEGEDEIGYWAEYAGISSRCRGAYLQWLSSGRTEPKACIAYVFIFFYGLERRLLVDSQKGLVSKEERDDIVNEIQRLLSIYGENQSFNTYANNLLSAEWALYRQDDIVPDYINLNDKYHPAPFKIILAKQVMSKQPIPADMALKWALLQENFWPRTPARRCVQEFQNLFAIKYTEKFGTGIIVPPNKTKLKFEYHPSSPSLRNQNTSYKLNDFPDPFVLTAPVKKLIEIAEECTNHLDAYSRHLGRPTNIPSILNATCLLPKELIAQNAYAIDLSSYLKETCSEGLALVPIQKIYEIMSTAIPAQFSKKDAENLALLIDGINFGMAPDIRFHAAKPDINDNICIFQQGHGKEFIPSREFNTVCTILRLGAMVSQSDKDVSAAEDIMLKGLIQDNRELTNIEKRSLFAFLHWILRVPQSISGLKQQLANISSAEKTAISHILISIAYADGYIDPREIKQIEKIYSTLGLNKDDVIKDIHTLSATNEPITVTHRDPDSSFSIPTPSTTPKIKNSFQLNEELIRIRAEETHKVKGVLESIFADDQDDTIEVPVEEVKSTNPLNSLDIAHQDLLKKLIAQETWERSQLNDMCKEMNLMTDGAMETLNEWAFNNANAPLIEDGDTVYVDINLAKEIINV